MIALASPLARLRRPLVTGALALLAGGVLLLWSQAERNDAEAAFRLHTNRLTQARALHQAAREADTAARDGLRQLETLRGAGLLDAPDRNAWQRHLLGLQGKLGLVKLEWEIAAFKPAAAQAHGAPAELPSALHVTTLHLKGEFAHEGRLLPLLERPGSQGGGLFLPRRCRIARNQPEPDAVDSPVLTADCEIDWIFLRLPATP